MGVLSALPRHIRLLRSVLISSPPLKSSTIYITYTLFSPLVPREAQSSARSNPSLIADLVGFFRSGISIFIACIGVSLLIKFAQLFYEYGSFHLRNEALSSMRLVLPVI